MASTSFPERQASCTHLPGGDRAAVRDCRRSGARAHGVALRRSRPTTPFKAGANRHHLAARAGNRGAAVAPASDLAATQRKESCSCPPLGASDQRTRTVRVLSVGDEPATRQPGRKLRGHEPYAPPEDRGRRWPSQRPGGRREKNPLAALYSPPATCVRSGPLTWMPTLPLDLDEGDDLDLGDIRLVFKPRMTLHRARQPSPQEGSS